MRQSNENPNQIDMVEELPADVKAMYDNPDLLIQEMEKKAILEGRIFERNRHIAVLDELKAKK